ncbi:carbamoyltransferase HypF [Shewanella sp. GXUN23E]|uniref:carbamoyltransferase HypF n=1 Tax=Shewanella sp. GXUN23E TaxID=3422498 RepID=UPI003D7CE1E7
MVPLQRRRIQITGIVQGVGFRPWIYRLAMHHRISGTVLNSSAGVIIECQGSDNRVNEFIASLDDDRPPLARLDTITITPIEPVDNEAGFEIIQSQQQDSISVSVSADKACCSDCLADMNDPKSRYFRYPFTNCTNCGPRYSIIRSLPYDRPGTAMAGFPMCSACEAEYRDPLNRRYHAQPVSCPDCGPQLTLKTADGCIRAQKDEALEQAVQALQDGQILAVKGLGGFHLMVDAQNQQAVERLRRRKHRQGKPLAVMVADINTAKRLADGSDAEWQVLASAERPIVLMDKAQMGKAKMNSALEESSGSASLADSIAPGLGRVGLFLPYTPLHHLLLARLNRPLVATSANISGEPIITDCDTLTTRLGLVVDCVLDHDRPIINGCDDSVVQVIDGELQVIRLARGYAPLSLPLASSPNSQGYPLTLATGPQQKNTLALCSGNQMILSPHIGDLFSLQAEAYFQQTLATFERLYQIQPQRICCDRHPDYATTRWAMGRAAVSHTDQAITGKPLQVQHHFAHVLAVMAANKLDSQVLGFSFDGTGLGDDGTLWGGELLLCDTQGYRRLEHLSPFSLIGMEQAVKQPWRLLPSLLFNRLSPQEILTLPLKVLSGKPASLLQNLHTLWNKQQSCIATSSVGRLFDALAALLGLVEVTTFEGEAGMKLEALASAIQQSGQPQSEDCHFSLPVCLNAEKHLVWDCESLFAQMLQATLAMPLNDERRGHIALGFHQALADLVTQRAAQYPDLPIVLTGGVFQNRLLLTLCRRQLRAAGRTLLSPGLVPVNDGGVALGQLWYGIHQGEKHLTDMAPHSGDVSFNTCLQQ